MNKDRQIKALAKKRPMKRINPRQYLGNKYDILLKEAKSLGYKNVAQAIHSLGDKFLKK